MPLLELNNLKRKRFVTWTTLDELIFLGLAWNIMQDPNNTLGYLKDEKYFDQSINLKKRRLELLKKYREYMKDRKVWGLINPNLIREPLNEEIRRLEKIL